VQAAALGILTRNADLLSVLHLQAPRVFDEPNILRSRGNGAWARLALGVTLTLAGLYQFTPLKRLCLRRCRAPLAFLKKRCDGCEDAAA
jgi:predicted metal-binding membrane protein